jgi:hypothetical protein
MLRFDGAVAAGALGVVCDLVPAPLVVVLLCANAFVAVHDSTNKTPHNVVGRNFIGTLFPARRSRPRAWL